jgi:predicted short-subunit dehydrogenase-like oxidoreductase (DUF2520 family)
LKPTVSIIGAGRMGTALAIALAKRGYPIRALVSRRIGRARDAAKLLEEHSVDPVPLSARQLHLLPLSEILVITTPDDAIVSIAARLAAIVIARSGRCTVLHTSGALSSEVLAQLQSKGQVFIGSMHPLVSVSDPLQGAADLAEAFFCIEGEQKAVRVARSIVRDIGGKSFAVSPLDKPLYHAAAVMASGHVVALVDIARELLRKCGLTNDLARAVLAPLISSTAANLSSQPPEKALTGTYARADSETVKSHLSALQSLGWSDVLTIYSLLGKRSAALARASGADAKSLKKIELLLQAI